MKKIFHVIFTILLCAQIFTIAAKEQNRFTFQDDQLMKGTEKAISLQSDETSNCYVFKEYVVKTMSGEAVGEDILIYKRTAATNPAAYCKTKALPYLKIKNPDANYFIGLSDKFLFIDSGTSVESRGLEIYNLNTKKSVYSTAYHDSVELQNNRFVLYDKVSEKSGAIKNCREAAKWKKEGLSVGWVINTKIDLQTFKETPAGALRCVALQ